MDPADPSATPIEPEPRLFQAAGGGVLPYLLLKPARIEPGRTYPLVLFYHGSGQRGDDNRSQWKHGVDVFRQPENRRKYPCFVAAPQCPLERQWVDVPWSADAGAQPAEPSEPMRLSLELLDALQREFGIDADRLYVTGISMGGYGAWDVITRHPNRFAAAVPVCGGGDETKAHAIARLPVWAFHGDADTVVKPQRSRNMIAAMRQVGGNPRYTEYPGVAHDSWTRAYHEPELLAWMFAQKRAASPARD
jgi:predicted peptidase